MTSCKYHCHNGKVFLEALGRFVPCPECSSIEKSITEPQSGEFSPYAKLAIPDTYLTTPLVGGGLFDIPGIDRFDATSVSSVATLFERIIKAVYSGSLFRVSAYVFVPNIVDVRPFVFGVQRLALDKGLEAAPYTDLNTLYGLRKLSEYKPSTISKATQQEYGKDLSPDLFSATEGLAFHNKTGATYADFAYADLCILRATASTLEKSWGVLADLLDIRASKGLPTYVLGYWASNVNSVASLRYLLSSREGSHRLDRLVPYEIATASKTSAQPSLRTVNSVTLDSRTSPIPDRLDISQLMG